MASMPTSRAGILADSRPGRTVRSAGGAAGFTLVELTIALLIMGIAAGLTLPMLSAMLNREGEKSAARIIQGVLRRAQAEALLSGRDWRVDFDWATGKCRAVQVETPIVAPVKPPGKDTPQPKAPLDKAPAVKDGRGVTVSADLPAAIRPLLAVTEDGLVRQPTVTSIVLRPQGLCQPAFIRLPETGGNNAAIVIAAVGCAVDLVQSDLDAAQTRFTDTHGQPHTPWGQAQTAPDKG